MEARDVFLCLGGGEIVVEDLSRVGGGDDGVVFLGGREGGRLVVRKCEMDKGEREREYIP